MHVREIDAPKLSFNLQAWRWLIAAGLGFMSGAAMMLLMMQGAAAAPPADLKVDNRLLIRVLEKEGDAVPAWTEAPLVATAIEMDVSGFVIRGSVRQIFKNPTNAWVEGVYKFPLPDDAAVDDLKLEVAGRVVEGVIQERAEAKRTYETAVAAGQAASLLEQERPNLFTVSVANIPPGEAVEVTLGYQAKARRDGDAFELTMPLVAAPRYLPPQPLAGAEHPALRAIEDRIAKDRDAITFPVSPRRRNAAAFDIHLNAGAPLASLDSPTHDLTVVQEKEGEFRIGLRQGVVPADRDFVLRWQTERGTAPGAALFRESMGGADYLLFMMLPPNAETTDDMVTPRDVTFVIDTSSSMHGDAMTAAKDALAHALEQLEPQDRFDIVAFNHEFRRLFPDGHDVTPRSLDAAMRFTAELQADGGTEMAPALASALSGDATEGAVRQVVFLTDGLVGNEDQLFGLIEHRLGNARLFTVGLGPAPNGWFMRKSAELGRGRNIQIADYGKAAETLATFYDGISKPVATDLVVGSEAGILESYPRDLPDLYGDEPVIAVMRLDDPDGAPVDNFALMGTSEGEMWTRHVQLDAATPGTGIAKLWARAKVDSLIDEMRRGLLSEAEARDAILEVALTHGITTRYTSLVAVDKTPIRPVEEEMVSTDIPADRPAGWTDANHAGLNAPASAPAPQRAATPQVQLQQASMVRIGGPAGAIGWETTLQLGLIALGCGVLVFVIALGWRREVA